MFIYLLTNICTDMPLDILGESEHGYMAVGGMMCHPILAQIQFTSSLRVFIYLLTNICIDMPLDILGEAEHGYMAVGGMMCHPILAQISPPA